MFEKLSRQAFWANCNPDHYIITTAVPLIILFAFGSLSKSIWIGVAVTFLTILFVYLVGKGKDHDSNRLLWFGIIAVTLALILYGLIRTPAEFIAIGVIYGIADEIVGTARDARLSREVANTAEPIETTIVIEFARSLGGLIGALILLAVFRVFNKIWQPILILGALTMLPKEFYSLKNIDRLKALLFE